MVRYANVASCGCRTYHARSAYFARFEPRFVGFAGASAIPPREAPSWTVTDDGVAVMSGHDTQALTLGLDYVVSEEEFGQATGEEVTGYIALHKPKKLTYSLQVLPRVTDPRELRTADHPRTMRVRRKIGQRALTVSCLGYLLSTSPDQKRLVPKVLRFRFRTEG